MAFKNQFPMNLHKTVKKPGSKKGEHELVGTVKVPFPTLEDFGISTKRAVWDKDSIAEALRNKVPEAKTAVEGQERIELGIPVYESNPMDWLQNAVASAVRAYSRNRFTNGTADLKPGMSLAEDFDALTADTQRTGEALKLRREAKDSFQAYLAKLGKQQATVTVFGDLFFNSNRVLGSASERYVKALNQWVGKWVETLDEATRSRFMPKLMELNESITAAQRSDTLDAVQADMEDTATA